MMKIFFLFFRAGVRIFFSPPLNPDEVNFILILLFQSIIYSSFSTTEGIIVLIRLHP